MENDEGLTPGQPETGLELETPQGSQGGDPLDAIKDPEALRYIASTYPAFKAENKDKLAAITDPEELLGEVKKIRSISQRRERKNEPAPEVPQTPQPAPSPFLTKADFEKSNEKKAIRMVTEAEADILENWDKVRALYTPRRGKETPEDILEDIKDAHVLYRARNPKQAPRDDSASELTVSSGVTPTGSGVPSNPAAKQPPNFSLPRQPKDWYKSEKK